MRLDEKMNYQMKLLDQLMKNVSVENLLLNIALNFATLR